MSELEESFEKFVKEIGYELSEYQLELARLAWNTAVFEACDHLEKVEGYSFNLDDMYSIPPLKAERINARLKEEAFAREHTVNTDQDEIGDVGIWDSTKVLIQSRSKKIRKHIQRLQSRAVMCDDRLLLGHCPVVPPFTARHRLIPGDGLSFCPKTKGINKSEKK
jgi:hypothetical protein